MPAQPASPSGPTPAQPVEEFLARIEARTQSSAHQRLLKAARSADPLAAMTAELAIIANEIVNEA